MKIKGWEKLNGFTYKGYSIVNTAYGVGAQGKYHADVLDLNTPNNTKWELSVLMPDYKFKQDKDITIILWDENKYRATKSVPPEFISEIKGFRMIFEDLVNELLKIRLISATRTASSHSLNGVYSKPINNNFYGTATTSLYNPTLNGVYSKPINNNFYGTATIPDTGGGIQNIINSSGTTSLYNPNTNLPNAMLVAIKELYEQIDELKQNTPTNPF